MEAFETLCQKLSANIPRLLNYGEGRAVQKKEGIAYVNDQNVPCSVNDGYDCVLFFDKTASNPDGTGFGKKSAKRAINTYLIAVNSKQDYHDIIRAILNSIKDFTYSGSSFESINIADQFFGLSQGNHETYFYTLEFTVTENINPVVCVGC